MFRLLCQHLQEVLGKLAIPAGQLADVPVERVARLGEAGVIDTAKEVIGRNLQRVRQLAWST